MIRSDIYEEPHTTLVWSRRSVGQAEWFCLNAQWHLFAARISHTHTHTPPGPERVRDNPWHRGVIFPSQSKSHAAMTARADRRPSSCLPEGRGGREGRVTAWQERGRQRERDEYWYHTLKILHYKSKSCIQNLTEVKEFRYNQLNLELLYFFTPLHKFADYMLHQNQSGTYLQLY